MHVSASTPVQTALQLRRWSGWLRFAAVKSSPHILGGLQGQNSCLGVSYSFRVRDGGLCSTLSSVRILLLAPPSGTLLAPPSGTLLADVLGGEKQKLVLAPCLLPAVMGVTCIQFIVQPNAMGCEIQSSCGSGRRGKWILEPVEISVPEDTEAEKSGLEKWFLSP